MSLQAMLGGPSLHMTRQHIHMPIYPGAVEIFHMSMKSSDELVVVLDGYENY